MRSCGPAVFGMWVTGTGLVAALWRWHVSAPQGRETGWRTRSENYESDTAVFPPHRACLVPGEGGPDFSFNPGVAEGDVESDRPSPGYPAPLKRARVRRGVCSHLLRWRRPGGNCLPVRLAFESSCSVSISSIGLAGIIMFKGLTRRSAGEVICTVHICSLAEDTVLLR